MATISASRFQADYSGVEPTVMQYINTIAQDWLTPVAPVSADHAMCLLPVTKRETVTTQQTNPDGSTEPQLSIKTPPFVKLIMFALKLLLFQQKIADFKSTRKKAALEQEWRNKTENKDKEPSDRNIIGF